MRRSYPKLRSGAMRSTWRNTNAQMGLQNIKEVEIGEIGHPMGS